MRTNPTRLFAVTVASQAQYWSGTMYRTMLIAAKSVSQANDIAMLSYRKVYNVPDKFTVFLVETTPLHNNSMVYSHSGASSPLGQVVALLNETSPIGQPDD